MFILKISNRSSLSLIDILCLLGGSYGAHQYRIFNKKAPFDATDIEVLNSVSNPELFLYTWNKDPRTYAMDQPELREHRLGIYDWIQRCLNMMVWSLMNGAYDLALLVEDRRNDQRLSKGLKISSMENPGELTNGPQMLISLFQMVGPIGAYPINQLETTDATILQNSLDNPDSRYLQLWYSWVIELFTKAVRTIVGTVDSNHPFVGGPLVFSLILIKLENNY